MAKEIERKGIPVAVITALPYVALATGANRVVQGKAIQYPAGDPGESLEGERRLRQELLSTALGALASDVEEPRLFSR